MTTMAAPAPKPCASCPYRQDVPSGIWHPEEYAKLPRYDGQMHEQPMNLFQCHQNDGGSDKARLCAGWIATHGSDNLISLRIAAASGAMSPADIAATYDYTTDVPVFQTGAEAAAHGTRDVDTPSQAAIKAVDKISKRRADLRAN